MWRARWVGVWHPPMYLVLTLWAWGLAWFCLTLQPMRSWSGELARSVGFTVGITVASFLTFWFPTLLLNTLRDIRGRKEDVVITQRKIRVHRLRGDVARRRARDASCAGCAA